MEILIEFRCDECGFDNTVLSNDQLRAALRDELPAYFAALGEPPDRLRRRPAPDVWSALEYACHMRDVVGFYGERIAAIATTDRPRLRGFGFGEAAERERYNEQDPATVAEQLTVATAAVAARLQALAPADWARVGIASESDATRDVRNCASRLVHEFGHHRRDIERSLSAATP